MVVADLAAAWQEVHPETVFSTGLEKLWREVRQLPPNQRETFIFSFANAEGNDLLSLLFEAEILTPAQMAQELGIPLDRMILIWKEIARMFNYVNSERSYRAPNIMLLLG